MGVGKASRQARLAVDRCSCYVLEYNLYRRASFAIWALRMLVGLIGRTVAGVAIPFIRHDPCRAVQLIAAAMALAMLPSPREWTHRIATRVGIRCCLRPSPYFTACCPECGWRVLQMEYLLYWLFFEFIGCSIARIVLSALSFGRVCVHSPSSSPERFNWFGYRRDGVGRLVVARDVTGFIGFIIMIVVCLAIVLMARPLWP